MDKRFTSQAQTAISLAEKSAVSCHHSYIGTEHLLIGLLRENAGTASQILRDYQVTAERIMDMIDKLIAPTAGGPVLLRPEWTPRARRVLDAACEEAVSGGMKRAGTEHILLAMLAETDCVACRLLFTTGIKIQRMYASLLHVLGVDDKEMNERARKVREKKNGGSNTQLLEQYSRDLTKQAREGLLDPVVGRSREIERILQILGRRKKNNPCLIGEPGVGKTAIVEGLARRIAEGSVPASIRDRRLMVLDLAGMVAGTKYRGEFEERIKRVLREITEDGRILLFIDELHTIIGAGGAEGALDASNILKPSLARGEIQLIGATTIDEYRRHIEKDAALERRFQPIAIEEPDAVQTLAILRELRPYYERHHQVTIRDAALEAAEAMSTRYISDRFQPDKALDLIDEASSRVQMKDYTGSEREQNSDAEVGRLRAEVETAIAEGDLEKAASLRTEQLFLEKTQTKKRKRRGRRTGKNVVTEEDVAVTVSVWTGIPVERITETESRRLARLEKTLHRRVVGQEEAVSSIARAVRRGRVGLKDPARPIGSFLFLGPTGVGKTELCKALAEAVFGSEDAMIRVDMSEYMEKHSVSKLIGSPPGYVGYDEGGQLSEKIRRHPYSVLLFDEIEKAHPDVFNILLQVLDDGHITDAQGRKVSFKETIIVMTSNAGASRIVQPRQLGFLSTDDEKVNYGHMKTQVLDEIRKVFRPEFLNRIDDIQVFHQLTKEDLRKIVDLLFRELIERCRARMNFTLRVTPAVKNDLIGKSYDRKYGARPLRRAIQTRVEDRLAEELLSGQIRAGDVVTLTLQKGEVTVKTDRGSEDNGEGQ